MALQCVVKIIQFYYDHMQPYMQKALFPVSHFWLARFQSVFFLQMCFALFQISYQAMSSDSAEVVLQGVEFWSTVCESEINLAYEEAEVIL